jgi:hypothetical protein
MSSNNTRDESHNIPFQIQHLIDIMLNKQERLHVRDNYRQRLESIRDGIEGALKKFKNEEAIHDAARRRR